MKVRIVPPLTQADIDRPTKVGLIKPVLAVYSGHRRYWPLAFWFAWCTAIMLLIVWLVR